VIQRLSKMQVDEAATELWSITDRDVKIKPLASALKARGWGTTYLRERILGLQV
jgi:hypothetical protein